MRKILLCQNFTAAAVKRFARVSLVVTLMILFSLTGIAQQAQLIKDINAKEELLYDEYSALRPAEGILYFTSRNKELWKTTGSTSGTVRLRSFNTISNLVHVGSAAYFFADDGKSGQELWKSGGTYASTVMVKDITTGGGTTMEFLTPVGSTVFFVVYDKMGKELWASDGTGAGTRMVKDIFPKGGGSNPNNLADVNGTLYFSANDGVHGYELWKSNGTAEGTVLVKDIHPELRVSSQPTKMTNVLGTAFFIAKTSAGRELWKSNGTSAGTVMVRDIYPGGASSLISNLLNVNGTLFFSAHDGSHGQELWKSNGTSAGTVMVKDMTPGPSGSAGTGYISEPIDHFADIGGILYFSAYENGNQRIWRSDGTTEGTVSLQDVGFIGWGPSAPRFARVNNSVFYFNAHYDEEAGQDHNFLWKIDRWSTTPVMVKELEVPADPFFVTLQQWMVSFNNSLIFSNVEGGGYKLFRYTATTGEVSVLKDVYNSTQSSNPDPVATVNNLAFFATFDESVGNQELWRTNGTSSGTIKVGNSLQVQALGHTNTHLYFAESSGGLNVWKTDGTNSTKVFGPDNNYSVGNLSAVAGNILYMSAYPNGLWRSDGTAAGTFLLKSSFHNILRMHPAGNQLLFIHLNLSNQIELWRSNGTVAGTIKLKTLGGSDYYWAKQDTAFLNGILYFIATDGIHGNEVWRSDGTAAGTYMFADLNSSDNNTMGAYDYDIASLAVYKNELYISALGNDGKWGVYKTNGLTAPNKAMEFFPVRAFAPAGDRMFLFATDSHTYPQAITENLFLYSSDGTAGGTTKLSDERLAIYELDYQVINNVIYCNTVDEKLFRSDGTACGSFILNTGVSGSSPMIGLNQLLIFRGTKEPYGTELFSYNTVTGPQSPCGTMISMNSASAESLMMASPQEEFVSQAPNPFSNDFSLQINGDDGEVAQVNVFTVSGYNVESVVDLPCNTKHSLGSAWPTGLYILKVNRRGNISTQKIIKK
jgi:ELWxxDGT repeat protein